MPRKYSSPSADQSARDHKRRTSLPAVVREYLSRRELLALVPLSMSSIDSLEKAGEFPSRFVLSPTTKVCWKRREVIRFLEQRADKRVHTMHRVAGAAQDRTEPTNQGAL
jgi:predicted DNA-binding transcriptional regulator AlpA